MVISQGLIMNSSIYFFMIVMILGGCADKPKSVNPWILANLLRCSQATEATTINNEFSNPVKVTINNYGGHAMEPFISRNGAYLFFNSLNDGNDTSLYYAARVDDVTFTCMGKINGVNGAPPHLDAVASMDDLGNFYFISTRNYPSDYFNVFSGPFAGGTVAVLNALDGDFYITSPGWIIMDGEISPDGNDFYYVNAHFSGGAVPDQSSIGVSHKSGAAFNKDPNTDAIMANINSPLYLTYAPSISSDGLELFFTRLNLCTMSSEIMVARRSFISDPFGSPELIGAISGFAEAPSLTNDKKTLYYHANDNGLFAIYKVSR